MKQVIVKWAAVIVTSFLAGMVAMSFLGNSINVVTVDQFTSWTNKQAQVEEQHSKDLKTLIDIGHKFAQEK